MITRQQLERLLQFNPQQSLITSCYITLDRAKMPPQMLKIRAKDLLQSAQQELDSRTASHVLRESLRSDFERIEEVIADEITAGRYKALVVFSCSQQKFWQTYGLPRVVRNILVANTAPYIRPLIAILSEYHRYCAVLVDRVHGRLFEIYLGEIRQHEVVDDQVPRRVSEGGLGGREERNIERRRERAVQSHFQNLADAAFALFKRQQFDWLVLGGHRDVLTEFKHHLHPYLKQRWVGDFHAEPAKFTNPEVLSHCLEIEERVEGEHEQKLADDLIRKAQVGHKAVHGLGATLDALTRGEAGLLLVEDGFESPGFVCYDCHHVSLDEATCPRCQRPMLPCPDVVDEAIEAALLQNCQIEHVHGVTSLRDAGRMGALLRFQGAVTEL